MPSSSDRSKILQHDEIVFKCNAQWSICGRNTRHEIPFIALVRTKWTWRHRWKWKCHHCQVWFSQRHFVEKQLLLDGQFYKPYPVAHVKFRRVQVPGWLNQGLTMSHAGKVCAHSWRSLFLFPFMPTLPLCLYKLFSEYFLEHAAIIFFIKT